MRQADIPGVVLLEIARPARSSACRCLTPVPVASRSGRSARPSNRRRCSTFCPPSGLVDRLGVRAADDRLDRARWRRAAGCDGPSGARTGCSGRSGPAATSGRATARARPTRRSVAGRCRGRGRATSPTMPASTPSPPSSQAASTPPRPYSRSIDSPGAGLARGPDAGQVERVGRHPGLGIGDQEQGPAAVDEPGRGDPERAAVRRRRSTRLGRGLAFAFACWTTETSSSNGIRRPTSDRVTAGSSGRSNATRTSNGPAGQATTGWGWARRLIGRRGTPGRRQSAHRGPGEQPDVHANGVWHGSRTPGAGDALANRIAPILTAESPPATSGARRIFSLSRLRIRSSGKLTLGASWHRSGVDFLEKE